MIGQTRSPRRRRLLWLVQMAVLHGLLATALSSRYFVVGEPFVDLWTAIYLALALPTHMLLLAFLPVVFLLAPLALLPLGSVLLRVLAPLVGGLGLLLLLIDTVVFQQYRFHLDAAVLDLLFGGAAAEIFIFPPAMWVVAAAVVGLLLLGEWFFGGLLWRRLAVVRFASRRRYFVLLWLLSFLLGHGIHMVADVQLHRGILAVARYMPAHWPLTARRSLHQWGLISPQQQRVAQAPVSSGRLRYPAADVQCKMPPKKPNILILLLDSWRYDMLTAEVTPQMHALAQKSQRFLQHLSAGNATRSGLFSLFYGIPPTYWKSARSTRQGAFLLDRAQSLGYRLTAHSSAPLYSPAFHETIFASVRDPALVSELGSRNNGAGSRGDSRITEDFLAFLEQPQQAPFFAFLFYDTLHSWSYPGDPPGPFQPEERINYLSLHQDYDATALTNYYRNSVHFVDGLVGRVLTALRTKGMLDDTVVLITGDHGQELNDNGRNYWGHNSNYSRAQIGVPLLLHWPGRAAAEHHHRSTHYDVSYTLLTEFMGCQAQPAGPLGSGYHLLDSQPRPWFIAGGFVEYAIVEPERVVERDPAGRFQILDPSYGILPEASLHPAVMQPAWHEMRRFLALP